MKRTTKIAAAVGAGGALLVGGTAAVTAAIVNGNDARPAYGRMMGGNGPMGGVDRTAVRNGDNVGPGYGMGYGNRNGNGNGMGMGRGGGMGGAGIAITAQSGTLSNEQKTALAGMAEEEKLAHDLYTAFAAKYDNAVFDRIAAAETRHLEAVRTLLSRYGVADPTKDKAAGAFSSSTVKSLYDKLLAQGNGSEQAALKAGKTVEEDDIKALGKAADGVTAPDVKQVYDHLLAGSRMHLAAFDRWID